MKRNLRLSKKSIVIISSITAVIALFFLIYFIFGIEGIGVLFRILAFLSAAVAYFLRIEEGCAISLIPLFVCAIFATLSITLIEIAEKDEKKQEAESLYEKIVNEPCVDDCEVYIYNYKQYAEPQKVSYVQKQWFELLLRDAKNFDYLSTNFESNPASLDIVLDPLQELKRFANSNNKYSTIALNEIKDICDSLYNVANNKSQIDIWRRYQKSVPSEYYKDSYEKIYAIEAKIEQQKWGTENRAWRTAQKYGSISAYEKYLKLYPNGAHSAQCKTKLIDVKVDNIFASQHGSLPAMNKVNNAGNSSSHITIQNSTGYELTILYSGPKSKEVVIKNGCKAHVVLRNGTYKIAASVNTTNVRDYAGIENLDGSDYEVEYYISDSEDIKLPKLPSIHF